jgi:hypothetical protein
MMEIMCGRVSSLGDSDNLSRGCEKSRGSRGCTRRNRNAMHGRMARHAYIRRVAIDQRKAIGYGVASQDLP